jgi:hypothetical protein
MLITGLMGIFIYVNNGYIYRLSNLSINEHSKIEKIANAWKFRGYPKNENIYFDEKYGMQRLGHGDEKVLLVGDSHASQY